MHASAGLNHASSALRDQVNTITNMQQDPKERFYRYFQQEATALQEEMGQLGSLGPIGGERSDAVNHVLASISRLESEVSDASDYIPAYDQRAYSQAIKALSEKLQETRKQVAPKARFAFKALNKNGSAISLADAAELAQAQRLRTGPLQTYSTESSSMATTPLDLTSPPNEPAAVIRRDTLSPLPSFPKPHKDYNLEISNISGLPGKTIRQPSFSQAKTIAISDHTGLHIILPASASHATSSGSITNLERCVVDMSIPTSIGTSTNDPTSRPSTPSPFAGLTLKNIENSVIIAGRVEGAAHITDVRNSVIVVSARQVRIHNSENTDVYLWCGSRPIIEGCSGMRFAELPQCYQPVTEPTNQQSSPPQNQWNQIDDFKWLKNTPSPNWSIIPPDAIMPESVWTDFVPGGPSIGLDDILRKAGVLKA